MEGKTQQDNDERMLALMEVMAGMAQSTAEKENREKRWFRVKIFMIISVIAIPVGIYASGIASYMSAMSQEHVAVVRIDGTIGGSNQTGTRRSLGAIRAAMRNPHSRAMVLQIDSGGGSPVQAEVIRTAIQEMRKKYPEKRVVVLAEDRLASAAYLIATGADEIYVQPSSLVGSIGVIFQAFSIHTLLDKVGVEVNTRTSGEYKDTGNMARPWNERDEEVVQEMLAELSASFIAKVQESRGDKLSKDTELFNGRVWTGERSVELGLADGILSHVELMERDFPEMKERTYGAANAFQILKSIGMKVDFMMDTFGSLDPGM